MVIELPSEFASDAFAQKLSENLAAPLVITFSGEIGAGKTTLIRALLRALGVRTTIKSPTFSLIESYQIDAFQVHHFDLYRIHDETELDYMGFRDYFTDDAICCIEWPERVLGCAERADVEFALDLAGEGRMLSAHAHSLAGESLLFNLSNQSR